MKRALELVEPLPAKLEDCFAQFDKVFDSLASQLEWQDAEAAAKRETPEKPETDSPGVPAMQMALVQPKPMPVPMPAPAAPPAPEPAEDVLQQYERAFSALDDRLAESDGAEVTALAERPKRRLPSDRRPAAKASQAMQPAPITQLMKPKRSRKTQRTFDEVFGMLDQLSAARRSNVAEEQQAIARLLADTRQLCADLELPTARVRVEFAVLTLESEHFDKLASEIDELVRHVRHDLRFCAIAPGRRLR